MIIIIHKNEKNCQTITLCLIRPRVWRSLPLLPTNPPLGRSHHSRHQSLPRTHLHPVPGQTLIRNPQLHKRGGSSRTLLSIVHAVARRKQQTEWRFERNFWIKEFSNREIQPPKGNKLIYFSGKRQTLRRTCRGRGGTLTKFTGTFPVPWKTATKAMEHRGLWLSTWSSSTRNFIGQDSTKSSCRKCLTRWGRR